MIFLSFGSVSLLANIAHRQCSVPRYLRNYGETAMSSRKFQNAPPTDVRRKTLEDDVRAFLESGKVIEQVPTGVSGQDRMGRSRKHIVLGNGGRR